MEALLLVGGSIASAVLDNLVSQVSSDAIQQFGRHWRLQDDLRRLRTTLLRTRFVLDSAEKRRTKEENLAQILQESKDAAYDAEDLLGEFEFQVLQRKAERQKNKSAASLTSPAEISWAMWRSPRPAMSSALRDTKCSMRVCSWAGHDL